VIDEEADHLAATIDTLLDLARLGGGTLPLDREPLHLPALTAQVVHRIRVLRLFRYRWRSPAALRLFGR